MSLNIRYKAIPKREVDFEELTAFIDRVNQILVDTYATEVVLSIDVREGGRVLETKWNKGKNTIVMGLSLKHTILKMNPPIYVIWLETPDGKPGNLIRIIMYTDWKVFVSYDPRTPTTATITVTKENIKYQIEITGIFI
jgi:hypothetical protein